MTTPSPPITADTLIRMFGSLKDNEHEITLRQLATLGVLMLSPDCSVREIAAHLHISKPAVTRALMSLERIGFVTKKEHTGDRRLICANATQKGRNFAARFVYEAITDEVLAKIVTKVIDLVDEQLPEGVHTGLRKAAQGAAASEAWNAVHKLSGGNWADACHFATNPFRNMWLQPTVEKLRAEIMVNSHG